MVVYKVSIDDEKCEDTSKPRYIYFKKEQEAVEFSKRIRKPYKKEWVSNCSELLIKEAYNRKMIE